MAVQRGGRHRPRGEFDKRVRNENTSLDGLRGIAASMGVGVLS